MKSEKITPIFLFGTALLALPGIAPQASSHREAPFITQLPKVDGTDFFMFKSYESGREGFVTIVADYIPFQDPFGGPNFYMLDPAALYEIHIDNNGDAKEDITFQFRFQNKSQDQTLNVGGRQVAIPLINSGPITSADGSKLNVNETYTLDIVRGDRRTGQSEPIINANGNAGGGRMFTKPVDNIGNKSIPDYDAYANQFIYTINIPGCDKPGSRVFVGQRKEPFVINVGEIFDLINTNPLGPIDGESDDLANKNITSLALEIPRECLTAGGQPVIGGWTTASTPRQTRDDKGKEVTEFVQVSRVGMPLVNEVVIGLRDKDKFNGSRPQDDAQFLDYVTNPTLPALIETLFPSAPAPTLFPRADLVAAFLTGINTPATGNLNQPPNVAPSEMLRLNTNIPPKAAAQQNNLGVIGGDTAGFPNGRRPGDDVVDIELRVAMGKLIKLGLFGEPAQAPAGDAPLTDGAFVDASFFNNNFPYLKAPLPGSPNVPKPGSGDTQAPKPIR